MCLLILAVVGFGSERLIRLQSRLAAKVVNQIYPVELQLNQANYFDTKASFFILDLSITHGKVISKLYVKVVDFNFEIVNFLFLDGNVPRSPFYDVYISNTIPVARVCSNVDDINNRTQNFDFLKHNVKNMLATSGGLILPRCVISHPDTTPYTYNIINVTSYMYIK